jgi:hypothetical protein
VPSACRSCCHPKTGTSDAETMEGSNLLKMVQHKLDEKEEIIHEQQKQINELTDALAEKDAVIRELMAQTEANVELPGDATSLAEKEELILEQMRQILELSEKVEAMEAELAAARTKLVEFDRIQNQLKELLGE